MHGAVHHCMCFIGEITLKKLLEELKELTDWLMFGNVIGISQAQLATIQQDGRNEGERKRLMFQTWMKLEKPTWIKVISSLFKCGMTTLGLQLANKFGNNKLCM